MNRIIATTGVAALSAVAAQPALAQDAKPWSVTASVRSFYDDNYATAPSKPPAGAAGRRSTWGLELSPSGSYRLAYDQTTLDLSSRYGMRYFEDRTSGSADHSLDFAANLEHRLTEKQRLSLSDSFAIAQEPGVLDPGTAVSTTQRANGNNIRNNVQLKFAWDDIIERWSGEASYGNTLFDYDEIGQGRKSALLDRVEHQLTLVGRYRLIDETETEILAGYSFGLTDMTSKDTLAGGDAASTRDSRSHYFFTGVGHKFTPDLRVNGRVGVQYVEYPNASRSTQGYQQSATSPYVDANAAWNFLEHSTATLGFRVSRLTTDIGSSTDAEATSLYSSVSHDFNPDLKGSLLTQYQFTDYRSPSASENYFTVGVNLEWRFHQFWSVEGGYNYDRLDADAALGARSYFRNRLYLGFKASW